MSTEDHVTDGQAESLDADTEAEKGNLNRRALILGATAAGAAAAATLITGAKPAAAADGGNVVLGAENTASDTTWVTTTSGDGLQGFADSGNGVKGGSTSGHGVDGQSSSGYGVYGFSSGNDGVHAVSTADGKSAVSGVDESTDGGFGVDGYSTSGIGVHGSSTGSDGVRGETTSASPGTGVHGIDNSVDGSIGVSGESNVGEGVRGVAYGIGGIGVLGTSSGGDGVQGSTYQDGNNGVLGADASTGGGTAVYATSDNGYGVVAAGGRAPLVLMPSSTVGAPTSGFHNLGEFYIDSNGALYRCVGLGTPGVWVPMYTTVPLASPVRVVDTRNGTGGITGPLTANTTATSSDLTGASGIPAAAIAVVGTVTMVATGQNLPGAGFLTVFPGGSAVPSTSNANADTGHAIASGLTVALGGAANAGKVSFFASFVCHALLDVAAYII